MEKVAKVKLFFAGFREGFKSFGFGIASAINFFLLLIVYFLGVGPVAIASKILKKHFIDFKKEKEGSYWRHNRTEKEPLERYERMY